VIWVAFSKMSAMILRTGPAHEVERTYALPNGDEITVGHERFRCPEALFVPDRGGRVVVPELGQGGIHQSLHRSVMRTDVDVREELFGNIILNGGSTMFRGLAERLQKEVGRLLDDEASACKVDVIALPERTHAAWIGGSVLASLPSFQQMWITREEYEEAGPAIVHRKCYN